MKNNIAYFAGNYWWDAPPKRIPTEHKKGKFFFGVYIKYNFWKQKRFSIVGFRLCGKGTQ